MTTPLAPLFVILDLDDCLIHSQETPFTDRSADFQPGEGIYTIRRPGLDGFLSRVFAIGDVAVWSSATEAYVDSIVQNIFPNPARLRFRWNRGRCTERRDETTGDSYWTKPLAKVRRRGYDFARVLIVDDDPRTAKQNYGNLVAVRPWTGASDDRDLEPVAQIIETMVDEPDVRRVRK